MGRLDQMSTRSEVVDAVEATLQDSSNVIFTAAEIGQKLDDCLVEIARYVPYRVRETLTTTADSRDLDISSVTDLLSIEAVEYAVGEWPRLFRNFSLFGTTLTLDIESAPGAGESVYLYCRKVHHLDADWEASTAYAKGQMVAPTTQNGYRYECTTAGTSGATEPTWGTTASGTTEDGTAVWTCRAEPSNTLRLPGADVENLLVRLTAVRTVQSKSSEYINAVNQGGVRASLDYQTWAQREEAAVMSDLRKLRTPRIFREHND